MLRSGTVSSQERRGPAAIMIVEDELIVAKDIARCLGGLGYEIVGLAKSAHEAFELSSRRCPDLALMDIHLQGPLDGTEAARILRERFDVPVIYLTAYADQETIARAKGSEPLGYITKPYRERELHAAVEIALHKHALDGRQRMRERWFSTMLRSIGEAVITVDAQACVTFMNAKAEQLTGERLDGALGRALSEVLVLLDEHSGERIQNPVAGALSEPGAPIVASQVVLRSSLARDAVVESHVAPLFTEHDELLGVVLVFRDLDERRQLEQQLAVSHRLSSLGTLAAGVGHEIVNPLTFIGGNVELVLEALLEAKAAIERAVLLVPALRPEVKRLERAIGSLHDAQSGVARVVSIVDDLRTFARPQQGIRTEVDVRRVLEWSVRVVQRKLEDRAQIVLSLDALPLVMGEETKLGQVFVNVLINAAQAIAPGKLSANWIRVSAALSPDNEVVVQIADTGHGMSPEVQARMYDPFFTTKSADEGTGLGLSVTQGIVNSLGGRMEVESKVDVGTTFSLIFPVLREAPLAGTSRSVAALPRGRGRVLVLDDEELLGNLVLRLLADEHEVTIVSEEPEAMQRLQAAMPFDAIICSVTMHGAEGAPSYEAIIASQPALAERLVLVAGSMFTSSAAGFLGEGGHGRVVPSYFSAGELREVVGRLVQRAQGSDGGSRAHQRRS